MELYSSSSIELILDYHLILVDYHQLNYVKVDKVYEITNELEESDHLIYTYPLCRKEYEWDQRLLEISLELDKVVLFIVLLDDMTKEDYKELLAFLYKNKDNMRYVFVPTNHDENYLNQLNNLLKRYMNIKVIDGRNDSLNHVYNEISQFFESYSIDSTKMKQTINTHLKWMLDNTYLNEDEIKQRCFDELIKKETKEKVFRCKKKMFSGGKEDV